MMDSGEKVLGCIFALIIVSLIAVLGIMITDAVWSTTVHDTGIVRGKEYEPATTRVVAEVDGNGKPTTRIVAVSEKFILLLQTEKRGHVTVEVSQSVYDGLAVGDAVYYTYHRGKVGGMVTNEKVKAY